MFTAWAGATLVLFPGDLAPLRSDTENTTLEVREFERRWNAYTKAQMMSFDQPTDLAKLPLRRLPQR